MALNNLHHAQKNLSFAPNLNSDFAHMILLSSILSEQRIVSELDVSSKKKLISTIAELFSAELDINKKTLFNLFFEREQLSSTGIGNGFALPHARTSGIDQAYGCLLKLSSPISFDAIDNKPIDLVFALVVPEDATDEHLKILASIAQMFSNEATCHDLRLADSVNSMLNIIKHNEQAA